MDPFAPLATTWAVLADAFFPLAVVTLGGYLWHSFALMRVFDKAGYAPWKAWVPFLREWQMFTMVGKNPAWIFLMPGAMAVGVLVSLIPLLGLVLYVIVVLVATIWWMIVWISMLNQMNKRFGLDAGFTVLAVFVLPAWLSAIAWSSAQWAGTPGPLGASSAPDSGQNVTPVQATLDQVAHQQQARGFTPGNAFQPNNNPAGGRPPASPMPAAAPAQQPRPQGSRPQGFAEQDQGIYGAMPPGRRVRPQQPGARSTIPGSIPPPSVIPGPLQPIVEGPAPIRPHVNGPEFVELVASEAPTVRVPALKVPEVEVPEVKLPEVKLPGVESPEVELLGVESPEVKAPEVNLPTMPAMPTAPEVSPAVMAAVRAVAEMPPAMPVVPVVPAPVMPEVPAMPAAPVVQAPTAPEPVTSPRTAEEQRYASFLPPVPAAPVAPPVATTPPVAAPPIAAPPVAVPPVAPVVAPPVVATPPVPPVVATPPVVAPVVQPIAEPVPASRAWTPAPLAPPARRRSAPVVEETDEIDESTVLSSRARPKATLTLPDGKVVALAEDRVLIGRKLGAADGGPGVQLISAVDVTRTVSKRHAWLERSDATWTIRDAGSTNGIYLVAVDGTETAVEQIAEVSRTFLLGDAQFSFDSGL